MSFRAYILQIVSVICFFTSLFADDLEVINDSGDVNDIGSLPFQVDASVDTDRILFNDDFTITLVNPTTIPVTGKGIIINTVVGSPVITINPSDVGIDVFALVNADLTFQLLTSTTINGNISGDNTSSFIWDNANANIFDFVISGVDFTLVKSNVGSLTLNGTNTYSGGTTLAGGSMILGNSSALGTGVLAMGDDTDLMLSAGIDTQNDVVITGVGTVDVSTGTGTLSGEMSGDALVKTGVGNLVLAVANSYTGETTLSAGTLTLGDNSALGTGALNMSTGTTLALGAGISVANDVVVTGAGTVNITIGTGTLSGEISGEGLAKTGSGILALSGVNTYTEGTDLAAGTIALSDSSALGVGSVSMSTGTTMALGSGISVDNDLAITGTGILNVAAGTATLSGSITGDGVTKNGSGVLVLSGNNTYSGTTSITAGTIRAGGEDVLSSNSLFTLLDDPSVILDLDDENNTIANLSGGGASGGEVSLGSATLTVGNAASATYSGVISGTGVLEKVGSGTLNLAGENTYSGGTTLSSGVITLGDDSALGTGTLTMSTGTTIALNEGVAVSNDLDITGTGTVNIASGTGTLSGTISGDVLAKTGVGILTLTGNNDYTEGTTLSAGTIALETNDGLGTGNILVSDGTTISLASSVNTSNTMMITGNGTISVTTGTGTLSGVISGDVLVKEGNSILALSGNNDYTGGTTLSAGSILLENTTSLGTGNLAMSTGTTIVLDADISPANDIVITGTGTVNISSGTATLSGGITGDSLTKTGEGMLVFTSGDNGYTGVTNIVAGTLRAGGVDVFSPSSTVVMTDTASAFLDLNDENNTIGNLSGGGASGGNVTLGSASLTVGNTSDENYLGVISGTGSIVKQGSGQLTLSNANTYVGGTSLEAGTLNIGDSGALGSGTLTVSDGTILALSSGINLANTIVINPDSTGDISVGDTATISGAISGDAITQQGGGVLIFTGTNKTYTGITTIEEGTLQAGNVNAFSANSSVFMEESTILNLNNHDNVIATLAGEGSVSLGSGMLTIGDDSSATYSGSIIGTGSITKVGSGTWTLAGASLYAGGTTLSLGTLVADDNTACGTGIIDISDGTILSIGEDISLSNDISTTGTSNIGVITGTGTIMGVISGDGIEKIDAGALHLTGANTYTGGTVLSNGTIIVDDSEGLSSGNLSMADTTTLSLGSSVDLGNDIVITGTGTVNVTTGIATLSGLISGDSLAKTGINTLILANGNTYSEGTTLVEGTLHVENNMSLGTGQVVMSDSTSLLLDPDITITNAIAITGTGTVTVNSGTTLLQGVISGDIVTKLGNGVLAIDQTNLYTGGTVFAEGTIDLSNSLGLGTGSIGFADGTTLLLADTISPNNDISITGIATFDVAEGTAELTGTLVGDTLSKTGNGRLVLTGTNAYTGTTDVFEGSMRVSANGALGTSTLEITDGATLSIDAGISLANNTTLAGTSVVEVVAATGALSGTLLGTGLLEKTGEGTLALSASNGYSGGTTISAGIISVSNNTSLGTGSVGLEDMTGLVLSSGVSLANNGTLTGSTNANVSAGNAVMSGNFGGTGGIEKVGAGTLTLSGSNVYTGVTTVTAGTLAVNGTVASPCSVAAEGTLQGIGTIGGDVSISGTIAPGNSIGTLTVNGNYTQASGSTFVCEISPTESDHLIVNGDVVIESNTTFLLSPSGGQYARDTLFEVITANGGTVSGKFSTFDYTTAVVTGQLFYENDAVLLLLNFQPFNTVVTGYNAENVAVVLDNIYDSQISAWDEIFVGLIGLDNEELTQALNQMVPAQYKGQSIVQQENIVQVRQSLNRRFTNFLNSMPCREKSSTKTTFNIWTEVLGSIFYQGSNVFYTSPQIGYRNQMGGIVMGVDAQMTSSMYFGLLGSGTYSYMDWVDGQGKGDMVSGYGGVYTTFLGKIPYWNIAILGARNFYSADRVISYPGLYRQAKNHHQGNEILAHTDFGFNIADKNLTVRPFDSFDYIFHKECSFEEYGAGVLDLEIGKSIGMTLRNELGVNFAKCFNRSNSKRTLKILFDVKGSWIVERRVRGKFFNSAFVDVDDHFSTVGYVANQDLVGVGAGLTAMMKEDRLVWSLYYNGAFKKHRNNQGLGVQVGFRF